MTDEEYGRAWGETMGVQPTAFPPFAGSLPFWKCQYVRGVGHMPDTYSEAEAYAALGKAVREVHRLVPMLPGEMP